MIGAFELYYPVVMSIVWIIGTLFFQIWNHFTIQRKRTYDPSVDVVVACYNEEDTIKEAVDSLEQQTYPNFRIVMVDDKSTDNTLQSMQALQKQYHNVHLIALDHNQGKAHALNVALVQSTADYILCIDADATFAPDAIAYLVDTIISDLKIAAVTGRPVIKNVKNMITALQYLEYITNIDFIKRAQSFFTNHLYTVSGVLALFSRRALNEINGWSTEALTEDIDATWRLYGRGYYATYQPKAVCYIYAPGTLHGFLRQRVRWARGGMEVLSKHFHGIPQMTWSNRLLSLDMIASYAWVFLVTFSAFGLIDEYLFQRNLMLNIDILITYYLITLAFYVASRFINFHSKIVKFPPKILLCLPIFFYAYWLNNIVVTFAAFYHVFDRKKFAAWGNSDRGNGV